MILLVGLGNPETEYAGTRHNVGFMALDAIVRRYGFSGPHKKFHAECFEGMVGDSKIVAIKPVTYMNRSGTAAQEAAQFYKISPEHIIVMHDDLDLPVGKLRVKTDGSAGGHKGLKSIDARIGKQYQRIRIGIDHPGDKDKVTSYVLTKFKKKEKEEVALLIEMIAEFFPLLVAGEPDHFMSKVALSNNQ